MSNPSFSWDDLMVDMQREISQQFDSISRAMFSLTNRKYYQEYEGDDFKLQDLITLARKEGYRSLVGFLFTEFAPYVQDDSHWLACFWPAISCGHVKQFFENKQMLSYGRATPFPGVKAATLSFFPFNIGWAGDLETIARGFVALFLIADEMNFQTKRASDRTNHQHSSQLEGGGPRLVVTGDISAERDDLEKMLRDGRSISKTTTETKGFEVTERTSRLIDVVEGHTGEWTLDEIADLVTSHRDHPCYDTLSMMIPGAARGGNVEITLKLLSRTELEPAILVETYEKAIHAKCLELVWRLRDQFDTKKIIYNKSSLFALAAQTGNIDLMADIAQNQHYKTNLFNAELSAAINKNQHEAIRWLAERGAQFDLSKVQFENTTAATLQLLASLSVKDFKVTPEFIIDRVVSDKKVNFDAFKWAAVSLEPGTCFLPEEGWMESRINYNSYHFIPYLFFQVENSNSRLLLSKRAQFDSALSLMQDELNLPDFLVSEIVLYLIRERHIPLDQAYLSDLLIVGEYRRLSRLLRNGARLTDEHFARLFKAESQPYYIQYLSLPSVPRPSIRPLLWCKARGYLPSEKLVRTIITEAPDSILVNDLNWWADYKGVISALLKNDRVVALDMLVAKCAVEITSAHIIEAIELGASKSFAFLMYKGHYDGDLWSLFKKYEDRMTEEMRHVFELRLTAQGGVASVRLDLAELGGPRTFLFNNTDPKHFAKLLLALPTDAHAFLALNSRITPEEPDPEQLLQALDEVAQAQDRPRSEKLIEHGRQRYKDFWFLGSFRGGRSDFAVTPTSLEVRSGRRAPQRSNRYKPDAGSQAVPSDSASLPTFSFGDFGVSIPSSSPQSPPSTGGLSLGSSDTRLPPSPSLEVKSTGFNFGSFGVISSPDTNLSSPSTGFNFGSFALPPSVPEPTPPSTGFSFSSFSFDSASLGNL